VREPFRIQEKRHQRVTLIRRQRHLQSPPAFFLEGRDCFVTPPPVAEGKDNFHPVGGAAVTEINPYRVRDSALMSTRASSVGGHVASIDIWFCMSEEHSVRKIL
jgi:hypothetical protein